MSSKRQYLFGTCAAGAMLTMLAPGASAQEAIPAKPEPTTVQTEETGIGDIVVTATRREERLQDVPISITAVSDEALQTAGVTDVRNLTQVAPGYFGGRNLGTLQPVIRGVGSGGTIIGDESNVSVYVDSIYQGDPHSTMIDLVAVDRVEVLRGPQGTVFGRNATGGLLNIITADPKFELGGRITAQYGRLRRNASDWDLRGYVTGPLSDNVAANLSVLYKGNDGYLDDLVRGGTLGKSDTKDVRAKVLIRASDTAQFILTGQYSKIRNEDNATQPFEGRTATQSLPGAIIPKKAWQVSTDQLPAILYERYNFSLRANIELGSVNLESTTSYQHGQDGQLTDNDGSNIVRTLNNYTENFVDNVSQEVRLLSTGPSPFQWILGGYAFWLKDNGTFFVFNNPVLTTIAPQVKTESYAAFAEGTYQIGESLFVTGGLRYTNERRSFKPSINGAIPPGFPADGWARATFNKLTYRGAIRYEITDKSNIYASYGTGFKSGVFNAFGASPTPVNPENVSTAEFGIKADPTHWLRTNFAIFRSNYDGLQVTARSPTNVGTYVLQNAAEARIYGGELEVVLAPTSDFTVRGTAAYTHAEYSSFPLAQIFTPNLATGGNTASAADVSGNHMIRTPRLSLTLSPSWTQDLAGGVLNVSANLFHASRVYFDFANNFSQKPYTLIGGEIGWTDPSEKWKLFLRGTNLTNAQVYQQVNPNPNTAIVIYERPITVKVGVQFDF